MKLEQVLEDLRNEGANPELLSDIYGGGDDDAR